VQGHPEHGTYKMELIKKKRATAVGINKPWEAYAFLTPWIIGLLGFTIIPMIMSLYFSFTQYDMLTPPRWIGLLNFSDMLSDRRLHKSLQVTLTFVFIERKSLSDKLLSPAYLFD